MKKYKVIMSTLLLSVGIYYGWSISTQNVIEPATQVVTDEQKQRGLVNHLAAHKLETSPAQQIFSVSQNTQKDTFRSFTDWVAKLTTTNVTPTLIQQGVQLAQARKTEMQSLMHTNPALALAKAVSLKEYAALPDAIKPYVEKPFSERVNIMVLPDDSGLNLQHKSPADLSRGSVGEKTYLTLPDSGSFELIRYGSRVDILSKDGIAAQGITLDGVAAIQPTALQVVSTEEADYIKRTFPEKQANTQRDFYTGEAIVGNPVLALAGGEVFYFASVANVERLNLQLATLENKTGPKVGSQVLFQPLNAQQVVSTPFATLLNQSLAALNTWTETPKSVYYIRVDFSDKTGEPITKTALETALSSSSDSIKSMSQNKTWLNYTVSNAVVRLPLTSAQYLTLGAGKLHDDAEAAFNALNTGVVLSNYDIVGVYLTDIGMGGWAGLAAVGGRNQWLQNYSHRFVLDHEFGHNYGLLHAHSWNTTDGSVIGAGNSEDYGDIYDAMGASYDLRATFSAQGRSKLNWLEDSQWQTVNASGNYRVYRFDDINAANNRALRISRGGTNGYYWVGHRQNFDSNKYMENGLYLLWQKNGTTESWLLDTTPTPNNDKNDAPIILGKTYADSISGIYITPIAKGGTAPNEYMDVQVNLGAFSTNQAPVLTGISGSTYVKARTSVNFSATVNDTDNDTLAYYWDFGDGVINPNLASISHQWAVGGTYTVKLTVSDMKGGTASTQITVIVEDPLNVWFARNANTVSALKDIGSNGSKLVAVGNSATVITSNDGFTWINNPIWKDESNVSLWVGNVHLKGITFDGTRWIAVGSDYYSSAWGGVIFTSSDGTTWQRRYRQGSELKKVVAGNGKIIAVGNNGTMVSSIDGGNTWVTQSSGTSKTLSDIAFGNGTFLSIGDSSGSMMVLASTDGITWSDRTAGANIGNSWAHFSYVDYLDNRFIASGWFGGIAYSTDNGVSFHNNQSTRQSVAANAYGNGLYFSAGVDNPSQGDEADINLVSTDGMNWTLLNTTSQPNRNAAILFNNTFITVGENGSIYQSSPLDKDTIPLPFAFTAKTGVALSTSVVSDPVLITDIDAATPWNVANGEACVSSTNTCACDITGFIASGTVTNGNYMCMRHTASSSYAGNVTSTLTVGGVSSSFGSTTVKNNQTIVFGTLSDKSLGVTDFFVSATASSGLAVTFNSQTANVCSVAGSSVHLIATGTCTIRASQAGNTTYNAAPIVDRSFTVKAAESSSNTDSDGDGVSDAIDQSPSNPNSATPVDQEGHTVTLETSHPFQNIAIVPVSTLPDTGKPSAANYQFPKGAIEYTVVGLLPGASITVTISFASAIPANSKVYKVSATGGYQLFPNATISGNKVILTLVDGGVGDDDHLANGQIVDPVAIAEPVNTTSSDSSSGSGGGGAMPFEWLLLVGGFLLLRRYQQCNWKR